MKITTFIISFALIAGCSGTMNDSEFRSRYYAAKTKCVEQNDCAEFIQLDGERQRQRESMQALSDGFGALRDKPAEPINGIKTGGTCFKKGEERGGMNKICYYDCTGNVAAITISSASLCPQTIEP